MRPHRSLYALGALALLGSACSIGAGAHSPGEPDVFLIRARAAESRPSTGGPLLRIASLEVAPHIRGIALVTDDDRVRTLVNSRFAAPIADMVTDVVADRLRATGQFGGVLLPNHPGRARAALRLDVREFEIHVGAAGNLARVSIDGTLQLDDERTVLRTFRAAAKRSAASEEPSALVQALGEALNAAIDDLDAAVVGGMAAVPEAAPPGRAVDPAHPPQ